MPAAISKRKLWSSETPRFKAKLALRDGEARYVVGPVLIGAHNLKDLERVAVETLENELIPILHAIGAGFRQGARRPVPSGTGRR